MSSYEFKLPDMGEGVAEGEVTKWFVSEGDTIKEDQPLVEVMTDKVNVEIPSPKAGKIVRIVAKVGEVVQVGQSLVVFEVQNESSEIEKPVEKASPSQARKIETPRAETASANTSERTVLATPGTRKYANELGVDIQTVVGSGPGGRVTVDDVRRASEKAPATAAVISEIREERVPLKGIRKTIAERMIKSAQSTALVTHMDEVDVTELMLLRNRLNARSSDQGRKVRLTFLPFLIKAVISALKEFPYVNASIEDQKQEIVLKKYYNIGVATDTEQGLVVPVVNEADKKNIYDLAVEIEDLVEKARTGRLSLEQVRNSTFTLTNVGSIGGLFSTPIINYPDVAILGIQRIIKRPVVRNESVVVRDMMNLCLSFDHRAIDGAYAARFLNKVIDSIQNPASLAN